MLENIRLYVDIPGGREFPARIASCHDLQEGSESSGRPCSIYGREEALIIPSKPTNSATMTRRTRSSLARAGKALADDDLNILVEEAPGRTFRYASVLSVSRPAANLVANCLSNSKQCIGGRQA